MANACTQINVNTTTTNGGMRKGGRAGGVSYGTVAVDMAQGEGIPRREASRKRAWRAAQKKLRGRSPLRANSRTCEKDPRSVKKLKHFCRGNHLSTSGNRDELVERVADFEVSTPCAAAAGHLHVSDLNAPPAARAALWSVDHLLPPSVRSPVSPRPA